MIVQPPFALLDIIVLVERNNHVRMESGVILVALQQQTVLQLCVRLKDLAYSVRMDIWLEVLDLKVHLELLELLVMMVRQLPVVRQVPLFRQELAHRHLTLRHQLALP